MKMSSDTAKVTVIISTYNRPDVLKVAIKSVVLQTFVNWKMIVIGDNCEKETQEAVDFFKDQRIKFINLPCRVGDQSGPNSVGVALAKTDYLAFMNQDDIWLEDHLERGIETLIKSKKDFFIGRCAFARRSIVISEDLIEPTFRLESPDNRTPDMSFDKGNIVFESVSSWIIKTELAKKIGYWKSSKEIHRTPMQNWVLRAWKKNVKFVFGDKITVLKINSFVKEETNRYAIKSLEHVYLQKLLDDKGQKSLIEYVKQSLKNNETSFPFEQQSFSNKTSHKFLKKVLINRCTKNLFRYTGIDCYEIYFTLLGFEKGKHLNAMSIKRVGKPLPDLVDLKKIIEKISKDKYR